MEIKTFIDLFSGMGGFHYALTKKGLDLKCVFASEIDKDARKTYSKNFKIDFEFNNDITKVESNKIPNHDLLCAGFPCQPFSQQGFKKGFNDDRSLFHFIHKIIKNKKPKIFILENVRHLLNHDNGKTFQVIKQSLEEDLNYQFHYKVLKASEYGLPQHRPRLIMVGFKNPVAFCFPRPLRLRKTMSDILNGPCNREIGYTLRVGGRCSGIGDRRNWDTYLLRNKKYVLTPRDGLRMMGFPVGFKMPVSNTQAMKQLGNGVAVNVINAVAKEAIKAWENQTKK